MKPLTEMTREQLEHKFSNTMGVPSYEYFPKAYSLVTKLDLINTIEDSRGIGGLE